MHDIFAEHQRKLRVELEQACRPLSRLLHRRDDDPESGSGGPLQGDPESTQVAMVSVSAGRQEGPTSAAVEDCGKQVAVQPEVPVEHYLRRISELEAALRNAKASGKRPQTSPPATRHVSGGAAATVVVAFLEPEEGEMLMGEQLHQLKEHVAAVQ